MCGIRYAWAMAAFALCGMMATPARAGVTTTGDTKDDGGFYAGYNANSAGTLQIDAGSVFDRSYGFLGYADGSSGTATVSGAGSTWTNSSDLTVGYNGSGALRVEAGGQVSSSQGHLGLYSGSTGTAIITGAGSKWTNSGLLYVGLSGSGKLTVSDGAMVSTKALYASLSDLYGNGMITVESGGVLDVDLSFDATHGFTQTLGFGSGGTLQFTVDGTSDLGVGYKRTGSLNIAEGRSVTSTSGILGWSSGSTGTAIVSGAGSKWTNSGELYVGRYGGGTFRVEDGAQISNGYSYLGYYSGSTGTAIVTGAGSKWTTFGYLTVGSSGRGSLTVSDGGQVAGRRLIVGNSQSNVRLHVSGDRMLVLGEAFVTGSINNAGRLSLLADAFLPAGTYRPIGEYADRNLSWSGSGSTFGVGGTWDGSVGTFTVIEPTAVDAGTAAEVAGGMRVVIRDGGSGERAGVSFGALTSGTTLTSLPLTESERAGLLPLLGSREMMLSGWDFVGELVGGETLVSFEVGMGAEEVRVWRLSQEGWKAYAPEMLTYDSKGL